MLDCMLLGCEFMRFCVVFVPIMIILTELLRQQMVAQPSATKVTCQNNNYYY